MKIAVIDYGASNLKSVCNALEKLGERYEVVSKPQQLDSANKVILPGVGAAGSAMQSLMASGFAATLPKLTVPVLGICLGLQLFAKESEEDNTLCLGIFPGKVRRLRTELKVPQIGWNKVEILKDSPLTEDIPDGTFFYFVNSYYLPINPALAVGSTSYDIELTAIARKGNFYGTQFHPEKSGEWGMKVLANFCTQC